MSKDSLVKGTIILTAAALVARFLGVFQRIPLVNLIGDSGMGSFMIAFNLYSVLLVIATAGIPSALSKMISEKTALGQHNEAGRIYRAARIFALIAGVVMAVLLYMLAPWYASDVSGDPKAVFATRAIAPALLMFPLIAIMRGYFQGRQSMLPNGISQVVEQVFRIVAAVGLAYALLHVSEEWAVAGASFGGVIGGAAALAVMLYYAVKMRRRDAGERLSAGTPGGRSTSFSPIQGRPVKIKADAASQLSYKQIYVRLFQLSIPIVLFSMTVTLIYTLDSSFIHSLLRNLFNFEQRREIIGIMAGRAQSLAGIPIILAIALSQSVVPLISAAHSQGLHDQLQKHTTRVLQLAILSGLPMVLMISTAARPIDAFVFGYEKSSAYGIENSPHIIALLTVSAIFQIIMQTSGAVLMGLGRMKPLVLSVILGVSVKIAGNYLLAPSMGIYGVAVSTGLCFVVMTFWNLYILRKNVKFTIFSPRKWFGLLVSTAIIALVGVGLEKLTHTYVHLIGLQRLNEGINAVIVCVVVLLLYPLLLGAMRVVTKADMEQFPASLQRLIGKFARLLGRKPPTAKMPQ